MATLINGNGNLAIYAQQDADWYAALMGGQTVITAVGNQFAYELLASNTIGVKDGVIITSEGRRIQLDANAIDSFDIPTGAQGTTNYYIIGYHLVTGNQSEQTCETFVQLMENGTDTIPEGSFRDGDDEVFVSLYRVEQDDLTIGTITLLLPQLSGSFQSQITELNNDLTDIPQLKANSKSAQLTYLNNKYGFTINGTFYEIGGSSMPILDFANPVHMLSAGNLSYTTNKELYLCGLVTGFGNVITLTIDGTVVGTFGTSAQVHTESFIPPMKIKSGSTVSISVLGASTIGFYDVIS